MRALLALFRDIALCRRGPEDLPVSRGLLATLLVTYFVGNFVQALLSGWTLRGVAPLVIVEIVMLLVWVWVLLAGSLPTSACIHKCHLTWPKIFSPSPCWRPFPLCS